MRYDLSHLHVTHVDNVNQISHSYANDSLVIVLMILGLFIVLSSKRREVEKDFLSLDTSDGLRGVAILLLVFGHFVKLCVEGTSFFEHAGDWAVIMFLFISGIAMFKTYGLVSLNSRFLVHRIRRMAFPVWISLSLFYLLDFTLIQSNYSWKRMLLNYLGILSPDLPNGPAWFITYIIFLYLVYFSVSKIHAGNLIKVMIMYALSYLCTVFLWKNEELLFFSCFGIWTHYTVVFPTAVLVGVYRDAIMAVLARLYNHKVLYVSLAALFALLFFLQMGEDRLFHISDSVTCSQLMHTAAPLPFILFLIMGTIVLDRLAFTSRLLNWLGRYSLEIFLLHYPFMVYYDFLLFRKPLVLFFSVYLIFILMLSIGLNMLTRTCNSVLFRTS